MQMLTKRPKTIPKLTAVPYKLNLSAGMVSLRKILPATIIAPAQLATTVLEMKMAQKFKYNPYEAAKAAVMLSNKMVFFLPI